MFPAPQPVFLCPFPVNSHPPPKGNQQSDFFHLRSLVPVLELIINIIIHMWSLCKVLRRIMFLRSIHVVCYLYFILFIAECCCLVAKSLCDPMNCSPVGTSVCGILQARILEGVAISFSRGSSWPRDRTQVSCIVRQILYHWTTQEHNLAIPTVGLPISSWQHLGCFQIWAVGRELL